MSTLKEKVHDISLNDFLVDDDCNYLFNIDDEVYFKVIPADALAMRVCETEFNLPKKWFISDSGEPLYTLTKRNNICELLKVILHIRMTGQELIKEKGLELITDVSMLKVAEKDVMYKYWGTNILGDNEYWEDMSEEEAEERRRVWRQEKKDMDKVKRATISKYYDVVVQVVDKERLLWLRRFHNKVPEYIKLINDETEYPGGPIVLSPIDWSVYVTIRGEKPRLGKTVRYATLLEYITRRYELEEKRDIIKAWLKEHPECNEYFNRMEFPPDLPPYETVTPREIFSYWKALHKPKKVKV